MSRPKPARQSIAIQDLSDDDLKRLRSDVEVEMIARGLAVSIGELGERFVLDHFNNTAGLPTLLLAPPGTKNVDALSRHGDRYSIKTVCKGKKTGTIYPDSDNAEKQLFEYLLVVTLKADLSLKTIHQFSWEQLVRVRSWDRRMSAWYVGCSASTLAKGELIHQAT